jgi:hypothetical protein
MSLGIFALVAGISVLSAWPAIKNGLKSSGIGIGWDGKTTFECAGNDDITLEDRKVELTGTVVIANGNCHLRLKNCTITGDTAIEAGGNAKITVEGGTITGKQLAVMAGGNAEVEVRGKLVGSTKTRGNARINK